MTHEPECSVVVGRYDTAPSCDDCDRLSTAYQRGREDAAQAVEVAWSEPMTRDAYDFADWPTITIAAARGDGEQA